MSQERKEAPRTCVMPMYPLWSRETLSLWEPWEPQERGLRATPQEGKEAGG